MIAIVDYGMGNVASVRNALALLGAEAKITSSREDFQNATHIILPGVGAFRDGMEELHRRGIVPVLEDEVQKKKKPFFGICLGMELLASSGEEGGETKGLDFIPGQVRRLSVDESKYRLPHIGWNTITPKPSPLFEGVGAWDFYFVHSYAFEPEHESDVIARCEYGVSFAAVVARANVFGTQFHPEKSQKAGLTILKNFINLHA